LGRRTEAWSGCVHLAAQSGMREALSRRSKIGKGARYLCFIRARWQSSKSLSTQRPACKEVLVDDTILRNPLCPSISPIANHPVCSGVSQRAYLLTCAGTTSGSVLVYMLSLNHSSGLYCNLTIEWSADAWVCCMKIAATRCPTVLVGVRTCLSLTALLVPD
jgi:hypothetical protein